jgi:hypothetical protein
MIYEPIDKVNWAVIYIFSELDENDPLPFPLAMQVLLTRLDRNSLR